MFQSFEGFKVSKDVSKDDRRAGVHLETLKPCNVETLLSL